MARRSVDIKIQEKGRDQGKLFKITEMSAFDTEKWAEQAINAILRNANSQELVLLLPLVYSYVQQTNDIKSFEKIIEEKKEGKATVVQATETLAIYFASVFFQLPYDELCGVSDPLLNCCSIYLSPGQNDLTDLIKNNINQYIEEASTIVFLKKEAFKIHTNFFTQKAKVSLKEFLSHQKETSI